MRKGLIEQAAEEEAPVDLTPMLDVVFIMLIFFIVTASFVRETGIDVNRPEAQTAESKENASILVAISESNEIWIDRRRVDIRSVRANVVRLKAENPQSGVIVQADDRADVKTLAEVLDAVREAGIYDASIATKEAL